MEPQVILLILGLALSVAVPRDGLCPVGWTFHNGNCKKCPDGFLLTHKAQCIDENECESEPLICGQNATCHNTIGSYYCTCHTGFSSSKENFTAEDSRCRDVNECVLKTHSCEASQICRNTPGSFQCVCRDGYKKGRGDLACEDINECASPGICGSDLEGNCTNTRGSYTCFCRPGHSNYGNGQGKCTKLSCDEYEVGGPNEQVGGSLGRLWEKMKENCEALSSGVGETAGQGLLEDVLTGTDDMLSSGRTVSDSSQVTGLLSTMEKAMMLIGPQLKQNRTKMESNHTEAELAVKRGQTPPTGPVMLSTGNASFYTSWEIAAGNGTYPGFTVAALISYKSLNSTPDSSFQALRAKLEKERKEQKKKEEQKKEELHLQMVSNVVTACVSNPDTHRLDQNISLAFRHNQEKKKSKTLDYVCVFWDKDAWSQDGCVSTSNSTHTVCNCNHLSSFAVLMALYDIKHTFELQLITWIGLAVSLVCLFICILTFGLCRSIKGTRTTIHLHLALCLFLADLVFLCGISRAQKPGCGFVAGLLHYFFLSAFSWMLLEGVQLYRMVVLVFHTSLRPAYMMAAGYGAPLAIVIISAIAYPQGYGTDQHCWLSLERGFIWAFSGPVCIIMFFNTFFLLVTLWKLAKKLTSLNPDLSNLQMVKCFTMTAVAQLCNLGGMWMFGCLMFQSEVMIYLFTILNSLQGAFIFVMHCLMFEPVREEYAKFLRSICTPPAKRRYTGYTSNPSSNSQQISKTNQDQPEH